MLWIEYRVFFGHSLTCSFESNDVKRVYKIIALSVRGSQSRRNFRQSSVELSEKIG